MFRRRPVNVVNAGIENYKLGDIEQLIDRVLIGLQPAVIIMYPGNNDIIGPCGGPSLQKKNAQEGIPVATIPNWVLTDELISKNTKALRKLSVLADPVSPEETSPLEDYVPTMDRIVTKLADAGIKFMLATFVNPYKNTDPVQRAKLDEKALEENFCSGVDGMFEEGNLLNDIIRSFARSRMVPLIDLESAMPGGSEYFTDSSHFTLKGERFAADFIYRAITNDSSLSQKLGLSPANN